MSRRKAAVAAFFLILLIAGIRAHDDYGLAWDEPLRYEAGSTVFRFLEEGKSVPTRATDDHGLVFELLLVAVERMAGVTDSRQIYLLRHLVTHLFFLLGVFGFYLLANHHLKDEGLALLGVAMLVISPRIYAHSFFNTKDIPFMVVFIFAMLSFALAFEARTPRWFLLHGVISGLLVSIRILGIVMVAFTMVLLFLHFIWDRDVRKLLALSIPYGLVFGLILVGTWPFLWEDPLRRFLIAFRSLSDYPWPGKVLYLGRFYQGSELPWHYAPVWMGITTPVAYTAAFIGGGFWVGRSLLRSPLAPLRETYARNNLLFLASFLTPLAAVIMGGSVLYDGWRHLYFIYPAFLMLALIGIGRLIGAERRYLRIVRALLGACLALSMLYAAIFMIREHPYQNVFFNLLVPRREETLRRNWDLDYWGVSYREGLEHILSAADSGDIRVAVNTVAGEWNAMILAEEQRARLVFVDDRPSADYFITNYRWHPETYDLGSEVYVIRVLGSRILSVFQMRD